MSAPRIGGPADEIVLVEAFNGFGATAHKIITCPCLDCDPATTPRRRRRARFGLVRPSARRCRLVARFVP